MKILYKYIQGIINISGRETQKFETDRISIESDSYRFATSGIFLNIDECLSEFHADSLEQLLFHLSNSQVEIPTVLNGTYVIAMYQKGKQELQVFNDLLSKHSLYYYHDNDSGILLISDSFFETLQMVKEHGLPYTIDILGVKMMLGHRMFYDNLTYIKEIKFLRPFEYMVANKGGVELKIINREDMLDTSLDEAANEIHRLFNHAVQLQYKKNEENGFPQVITMSGGMDSRSTFLYGLANGYAHQTGYCYGESTSMDFDYARQLAVKNQCEFYFHAIDNGNFLLERDKICEANEGSMVYSGPSGCYDSLRFYATDCLGIVHTGLGGGEIMGDMRIAENPDRREKFLESLRYRFGKGKKDRSWDSFIRSLDCNEEDLKRINHFKAYYRDLNEFQSLNDIRRCLNSQKIAHSFGVEYVSPFLYEDFFCYMLRIPYEHTKGRKLYLYWQKKYNPKQFETPSTFMLGCKPGNQVGYYGKLIWQRFNNRIGRKTKMDMNPYEYWIANNSKLLKSQETMFRHDMEIIGKNAPEDLVCLLEKAWSANVPKPNVLTATWALSKIFEEKSFNYESPDSCKS